MNDRSILAYFSLRLTFSATYRGIVVLLQPIHSTLVLYTNSSLHGYETFKVSYVNSMNLGSEPTCGGYKKRVLVYGIVVIPPDVGGTRICGGIGDR